MRAWIRVALTGPVVARGLRYAVVVGAVLALINHGDLILTGRLTSVEYVKIVVTVAVPYCVSVASSVGAILDTRDRTRTPFRHVGAGRE